MHWKGNLHHSKCYWVLTRTYLSFWMILFELWYISWNHYQSQKPTCQFERHVVAVLGLAYVENQPHLEVWTSSICFHDDIIKRKHFPCYWSFMRGIPQWPVNSPHKGQWHGTLMFYLICAWTNAWVNKQDPGDLRCHCAYYDITVMCFGSCICKEQITPWNEDMSNSF